jgi:hypothetical protein
MHKAGPGVLGTLMEMHNSLIASFASFLFALFFFSMTLLLYNSLKPFF